jgi:hypothetical protein
MYGENGSRGVLVYDIYLKEMCLDYGVLLLLFDCVQDLLESGFVVRFSSNAGTKKMGLMRCDLPRMEATMCRRQVADEQVLPECISNEQVNELFEQDILYRLPSPPTD